jgi:hypothetical protein
VDDATYKDFQAKLSAVATRGDVERLAGELRAYGAEHPEDPDVPALGEQLAMVRQIRGGSAAPG